MVYAKYPTMKNNLINGVFFFCFVNLKPFNVKGKISNDLLMVDNEINDVK